jgi:hypothetical protein
MSCVSLLSVPRVLALILLAGCAVACGGRVVYTADDGGAVWDEPAPEAEASCRLSPACDAKCTAWEAPYPRTEAWCADVKPGECAQFDDSVCGSGFCCPPD